MSDLQFIETALARAARRRRWDRALRGMWQGLLAGALLWLLALAIYKLVPIPSWSLPAAAGTGAALAVAGLIWGGWRRMPLNQAARWVDGKEHLQERLSTALEVGKTTQAGAWRDLVVSDAVARAKELDPRKLVRFQLTRASRWALAVLALAAGLGFVPEYRSKAYVQKEADKKVIQDVGKQLLDLTKRSLEQRKPTLEPTEKAMQAVNELGDQLAKQQLTRGEALKDVAKVTDRLQDQLKEMGKDPAMQRMQQEARSSANNSTSPEMARLQKQIEDAKKQLGTPTGTPEDMEKMKQALNKIEQAAKAAMDKNGGMSPSEKEKLSQSMTSLSKQAQEMGMQTPNLDQAIQALEAAQTDMMLKDLDLAVQDLEKTQELARNIQQMQMQSEKMGKDLAEQLKFGQPENAQATLQKMTEMLKSGKMTPEQLQKMMDEVSKAVDPASQYGKVAQHLKEATKQLAQGQKPGAAKSLDEASKELEKLMQQMGDAQALMAELDALKKASMCIGTCQGWGQCNKPGFNPNGKRPGKGVGTWADEYSGWDYNMQQTERWDNSGITRPDQAPHGFTDRGDGELNPALRPDKVKGQFSPGGQMPSITLKGVSIKGQSKVAYEEAPVAAQSDAQSALSLEKVPRAYQGTVRDYFDDSKQ